MAGRLGHDPALHLTQKVLYFLSVFQYYNISFRKLRQHRKILIPMFPVICPHPTKELPIYFLRAPFRHIRPHTPHIFQVSIHYAPNAEPSGKIQINNHVTLFQTMRQGPGVITIHYPFIFSRSFHDFTINLIFGRFYPSAFPKKAVNMNHWQARSLSEFSSKSTLSCSTAAHNLNAIHHFPPYAKNDATIRLRRFQKSS